MSKETNKGELQGVMAKGYGTIPKLIMKDKDLTIEAKAIYAYLASYSGAGETAYPSVSLMCSDLGIGEDRFYRHRKKLIEKDYIKVSQHQSEGGWSNNLYTIVSIPYPQNTGTQNKDTQNTGTQNKGTNNNSINNNSTNNNNKDKGRKYTFDDTQMELAELLWGHVETNYPKTKKPNLENWANDIRLMMEQDKRTVAEIRGVIEWSQKHNFWYSVIRSARKLREKYEDMYAQADRDRRISSGKTFEKQSNHSQNMDMGDLEKMMRGE